MGDDDDQVLPRKTQDGAKSNSTILVVDGEGVLDYVHDYGES